VPIRGAALLLSLTLLAGCSAATIANAPGVGEPANTPARSETATPFLPVHDVPPPREEPVPTLEERTKLQKELLATRDRQNAEANSLAKGTAPPKKAASKKTASQKPSQPDAKAQGNDTKDASH